MEGRERLTERMSKYRSFSRLGKKERKKEEQGTVNPNQDRLGTFTGDEFYKSRDSSVAG